MTGAVCVCVALSKTFWSSRPGIRPLICRRILHSTRAGGVWSEPVAQQSRRSTFILGAATDQGQVLSLVNPADERIVPAGGVGNGLENQGVNRRPTNCRGESVVLKHHSK